jgi:chemotaxis protein CheD
VCPQAPEIPRPDAGIRFALLRCMSSGPTIDAVPGQARLRVVGTGQFAVSTDPDDTLITYGLGGALGITAYDRVARVGGLVHALTPVTALHVDEAQRWPSRFVETGVSRMLDAMYARGARKDRVEIRAAGGARTPGPDECFAIGRRNVVALKKVLWQRGMLIRTHDVGGPVTRTLSLCIEDGRVEVDTPTTSRALGGDLPWF